MSNGVPAAIQHRRCAVHTLHLAKLDGIKNGKAAGVIGKIRDVAKEAHTPKLYKIFLKRTRKTVLLDMDTRWGSTYLMLARLTELKTTIQRWLTAETRTCPCSFPVGSGVGAEKPSAQCI